MKIGRFALALIALAGATSPAATPPARINFQGVLRSAAGAPLNGTFDVILVLYSAPVGGDQIMLDSHTAGGGNPVVVSGGLFNTQIGGGTPADGSGPGVFLSVIPVFTTYANVYVEVRVAGETLSPRVQVVSAGHALNTENANRIDNLDSLQLLRSDTSSTLSAGTLATAPATTLDVNGALQLPTTGITGGGTGSGLDADLLDGLSSSSFAPSVHTHPGTDVTSPVAQANVAPWAGLTGVPPGFADGIDNDSGAIGGLAFRPFEVTTFNEGKVQPRWTAIAIGQDGLPLIVHASTSGIYSKHCDDVSCRTATGAQLEAGAFIGVSLAIPSDGRPLLSYVTVAGLLKVARCSDAICSSLSSVTSLATGCLRTSITTGANGFGVLVADENTPRVFLFACTNADCSSSAGSTLPSATSSASITMGVHGQPTIAYYRTGVGLELATCLDATCSSYTSSTVAMGTTPTLSAVTIRGNGAPSVVFAASGSFPRVITCADPACSTASTQFLTTVQSSSAGIATALDGEPLVVIDDALTSRVAPVRGGVVSLSGQPVTLAAPNGPSVAIGQDGLPIVAWADTGVLKVMHCSSPACIPHFRGR